MKKALVASAASLLLAAVPIFGSHAVDSQSHDVTIGNVDETIYQADIYWGDFTFDWKYDDATSTYDLQASLQCRGLRGYEEDGSDYYGAYENNGGYEGGPTKLAFINSAHALGRVYTDSNCSTVYTGEIDPYEMYYLRYVPSNFVRVIDTSVNGAINVGLSFTPEEKYTWVDINTNKIPGVTADGKIIYQNNLEDFPDYVLWPDDTVLSGGNPGGAALAEWVSLKKDPNETVDAQSITAGDKIGTITINLIPKE